jgi:membrane-bound lytic murein transglycosylase B
VKAALLATLLGVALAAQAAGFERHADATAFATEMAERHGLPRPWVMAQLRAAKRVPKVRQLVMPAAAPQAKHWAAYRARFVEPQRIAAGLAFWQSNAGALDSAEQRWGVPAEIVVAIVGVETFYGRITGGFAVRDALATLAFDFPRGRSDRSAFFRDELGEFLAWARREGIDPGTAKGSFAGAMGLPQFMPGSVNRWAVDFDGDGHVNLLGSATDAVGSVAHFLAGHGWQRGLPTHHTVEPPEDRTERAVLLAPDIDPRFSAAEFAARGARLDEAGRAHEGLLALVELHNAGAAPSYVAGTQNFWVLTRYNRSSYYALAVAELAMALREARQR